MIKQIWRFRLSVLPGGIISISLLFLAFAIFYILFLNADYQAFTDAVVTKRVVELIKFTIFQAFLSTLLSIVIGTILAWALAHQNSFRGRDFLVALLSSSLVLPTLIVVFGVISVLGRNGWLNRVSLYLFDYTFESFVYGLSGILIAHVYLNASFAARTLLHAFEAIPIERYKLAKSLNFSVYKRFVLIEFQAIKSSLKSVSATIFLLCFTSFAIILTLGGSPAYNTLEVAIYEAVKLDFDIPLALKLAFIQLFITIFLVFISSDMKIDSSDIKTSNQKILWLERRGLQAIQICIISVFTFLFLLPLFSIIIDGLGANFVKILSDDIFIKSFLTSIGIASISSIVTVVFALFISDSRRNFTLEYRVQKSTMRNFLNKLIAFSGNIYLAIPSLILGLSFFMFSLKSNLGLTFWALFAIICANVLMSLPFALSVIYPPMQKIAKRYDRLSSALNLKGLSRWIYCEGPYIKESVSYVFALSFCLSLGDLGVVALFGSNEITTLPWYLYGLIGSYQTKDGAGVALILLVLTLAVFIYLPKVLGGKRVA